jgi:hypothetical protein
MSKFKSVESRLKRRKREAEYLIAHRITLDFAFYDPIRADKVYTVESEKIIRTELKEAFSGAVPEHAVNHEFGEVLNHFGV